MKIHNGGVLNVDKKEPLESWIKQNFLFNENHNTLLINNTAPSFKFYKGKISFKQ